MLVVGGDGKGDPWALPPPRDVPLRALRGVALPAEEGGSRHVGGGEAERAGGNEGPAGGVGGDPVMGAAGLDGGSPVRHGKAVPQIARVHDRPMPAGRAVQSRLGERERE